MPTVEITKAYLEDGKVILECPNAWEKREIIRSLGKPGVYDIAPHKELRSTKANNYMWALAEDIAKAVRITKEEVYREAVKRVGPYKDFPPLPEDDAKTLSKGWEMIGTGWTTERVDYDMTGELVIIRCYYGSSVYNTKQMARLIDDLVEDAHNLGLETYDDGRIQSLLEEYENEYQRIRRAAG